MNRWDYQCNLEKYRNTCRDGILVHTSDKDREWEDHKYIRKEHNAKTGKDIYIYDNGGASAQSAREAEQRKQYELQKAKQNEQKVKPAPVSSIFKSVSQPKTDETNAQEINNKIQDIINNNDIATAINESVNILKETPEVKTIIKNLENEYKAKLDPDDYSGRIVNDIVLNNLEEINSWKNTYSVPAYIANEITDVIFQSLWDKEIERQTRHRNALEQEKAKNAAIRSSVEIALKETNPEAYTEMKMKDYDSDLNKYIYYSEDQKIDLYDDMKNTVSELRAQEQRNEYGIPLKDSESSTEEDMLFVNYGRRTQVEELSGGGNCAVCTLAMDLRSKGYDVSASFHDDILDSDFNVSTFSTITYRDGTKEYKLHDSGEHGFNAMYTNSDEASVMVFDVSANDKNDIMKSKNKEKEVLEWAKQSENLNTSGALGVQWDNADYGHGMYYKINDKGIITIYDGQIAKTYTIQDIMLISHDWKFIRTDNLEPNWDYLLNNNIIDIN